jgi:hypothetical protein
VKVERRRPGPSDDGSVTAEMAVALPALVLFLIAGLTAVVAVSDQMKCQDAAREAARADARGDGGAEALALRSAPGGATIHLRRAADSVEVEVSATVHPFGSRLPGVRVTGTAVAEREPGAPYEV